MSSQFSLLKTHRFGPFFQTQFLGAFNDNLFKNALVVLLTFQAAQWTAMPPELLANLAAGVFTLPFFLFSATAACLLTAAAGYLTSRAIPIAPVKENPALMEKAFADVAAALANGELCAFRPEISRILEKNPVPVVPMALSGLWGSIFSRRDGQALSRPWKARPFRKIALAVGEPVAAAASVADTLRDEVLALRGSVR